MVKRRDPLVLDLPQRQREVLPLHPQDDEADPDQESRHWCSGASASVVGGSCRKARAPRVRVVIRCRLQKLGATQKQRRECRPRRWSSEIDRRVSFAAHHVRGDFCPLTREGTKSLPGMPPRCSGDVVARTGALRTSVLRPLESGERHHPVGRGYRGEARRAPHGFGHSVPARVTDS